MVTRARSRPRAFAFADSGESSYARPAMKRGVPEKGIGPSCDHRCIYVQTLSSESRCLRNGRCSGEDLDLNAPNLARG